ncbi:MAG TPA: tail fiber domain-containing protein [Thermoanaerobaculia bacterium]|nr:tail fiber domain-containing protein [Thermoanaerobaculia bacterium]
MKKALLILIISTAAFGDVARMEVSATSVVWTPLAEYETVGLTVVGPNGEATSQQFAAGKSPTFSLASGAAEGFYRYELRAMPKIAAGVKAALQDARAKNDDEATRRILRDSGIALVVQSGSLLVRNGAFLSPDTAEGVQGAAKVAAPNAGQSIIRLRPRANDNVIADDLIVQGSACVGLDCVNNESFGFDTIRLKENNNRIRFDDTSSSSGFANTDWQITANESTSGGANKFSVEDVSGSRVPFTILAGAITHSLFVDSIGRIGVGTSTPTLDLQPTNLDTPSIRLDQPSGAFAAQAWDVAGNEVNFFIRDHTHGSLLPFRIRPGAPTSSIHIAANGNVGIGTDDPAFKLDVVSAGSLATINRTNAANASGIAILRVTSGNGSTGIKQSYLEVVSDETSDTTWRAGLQGSTDFKISDISSGSEQNRVTISAAGNIGIGGVTSPTSPLQHSNGAFLSSGGAWTNASSRDLKDDIHALDGRVAEETLGRLEPVTFRYKNAPAEAHVGFIAEDVPDLVAVEGRKGLSAMDIVAVLTRVVQDQQKTMQEQQKTIDALAAKVEQLEKKQEQ